MRHERVRTMLAFLVKSSTCRTHWVTVSTLPLVSIARSLFFILLKSAGPIPLFPRVPLARSEGAFSPIWLCNVIYASNNSRLLKLWDILYLFLSSEQLFQLFRMLYVSASTNLVGKFTQSVRRIVQDVKDEGTSSKPERYFITFISRGSLIKL